MSRLVVSDLQALFQEQGIKLEDVARGQLRIDIERPTSSPSSSTDWMDQPLVIVADVYARNEEGKMYVEHTTNDVATDTRHFPLYGHLHIHPDADNGCVFENP